MTTDSNGKSGEGVFDVTRKDLSFIEYAEINMWPHVKLYSFADSLKSMCVEFFGLTPSQVYGTNDQKNTETHMRWKDMPSVPDSRWMVNTGAARGTNMTAREFMQHFGTNVMRQMYGPVWVEHAINTILSEQTELAIVADVRFPNEVEAIQKAGGTVIRLTRNKLKDSHDSETALDKSKYEWSNFDHVVDNSRGGVDNLCSKISSLGVC